MLWIALGIGMGVALIAVVGGCMVVATRNARRITEVVPQKEGKPYVDGLDVLSTYGVGSPPLDDC